LTFVAQVPNRAAVPLGTFDSADQEGQGQSRLRPGIQGFVQAKTGF